MDLRYRTPFDSERQRWRILLRDSSGALMRGIAVDEGARAHYLRDTETSPVQIDLQRGGPDSSAQVGLREIDSRRLPGLYDFFPPDELFRQGATSAIVLLHLAPARPVVVHVDLVAYDPYDGFALRLANFIRSTCHDHLSSAFYRVMPPSVRPMVDLLLEGDITQSPRPEGSTH